MKSNLRTEVLRIISFLNLTHIPSHVLEEEILPSFGFSSMKNNIEKFQPKSVGSTNDSGGGKEEGESSELMDAYNDWVEREEYEYRSMISVLQGDCNEDCREAFLSVEEK
eukprot:scaffold1372_cov79-Skeletonema_marinoi.AAC.5